MLFFQHKLVLCTVLGAGIDTTVYNSARNNETLR